MPIYDAVVGGETASGLLKRDLVVTVQRFGTVWINAHITIVSEMPHGGFVGESGYGKDMSGYAIEDYTVIKHIMAKLS